MRSTSTRIAMVILLAGFTALAAGCGGGGGSGGATNTGNNTTNSAPPPTTSSSGSGGGAEPSFASAKNCEDLAGIASKAAAALAASGNASTSINTEATLLNDLANSAPSDIRSDFQTIAAAFSGFVSTLQNSGYKLGSKTPPTAAQAAALEKAAKSFDTPKLKSAEQHLEAWGKQNCKGVKVGG
jgi:hypothetical protein